MIIATNIALIIIALIILIYILERDLGLFLLSFIILLQYIWMFCSILVIENGIYINEQGRNGYFVYSGFILLLFYVTSLLSLIFYKKTFGTLFKKTPSFKFKIGELKDINIASILIGTILGIAYFNLFNSPIPLFSEEVTKFNFWEYAKYPFLKSIIGNVIAFAGFGAALLYRFKKRTSIFYLTLYIGYLILMDQKFTGFLIAIYGILVALYFSSNVRVQFKLKWILNKYLITIVIALFCLVYYKYSVKQPFKYMGLTPLESVFYRAFGLQAHVFWGTTEHYIYNGTPNTWNLSELWKGMHVLMREFWPWSYEAYISVTTRGVSWTNAYPSILLRIFPLPIALLVNMLLLSVVGFFQSLLATFIERRSFVLSIVFFQLLMWVSYAYTMAYFNKLIIPFILLFALSFFTFLINKTRKNESEN